MSQHIILYPFKKSQCTIWLTLPGSILLIVFVQIYVLTCKVFPWHHCTWRFLTFNEILHSLLIIYHGYLWILNIVGFKYWLKYTKRVQCSMPRNFYNWIQIDGRIVLFGFIECCQNRLAMYRSVCLIEIICRILLPYYICFFLLRTPTGWV